MLSAEIRHYLEQENNCVSCEFKMADLNEDFARCGRCEFVNNNGSNYVPDDKCDFDEEDILP